MDRRALSRRSFLRNTTGTAAAVLASSTLTQSLYGATKKKPNILLIMGDDVGYEIPTYSGGESYNTPTLDKLSKQGIEFSNCYATPTCSPSRVMLMTGQYPYRTSWIRGIWERPDGEKHLDPSIPNFASVLKSAGYTTAVAGKWQLNRYYQRPDHPKNCGFDEHLVWGYGFDPERRIPPRYWEPVLIKNGKHLAEAEKPELFGPDLFTDFMIDFIKRNKKGPFFAYFPMCLVHVPFKHTPANKGKELSKQERFAGLVEYHDMLIGKLLETLDKLGLRDDTVVLYTGDNGTPRGVTSKWRGLEVQGEKHKMSYFGTHVPCLVHWPHVTPKGKKNDDLIDFSDFMPTLAEIAGGSIPKDTPVDGISFLPQIQGRKGFKREWIFTQVKSMRLIRDKRWQYSSLWSKEAKGPAYELYDIKNDPFMKNPIPEGKGIPEAEKARKKFKVLVENPVHEKPSARG